jgi:hypothetical protein
MESTKTTFPILLFSSLWSTPSSQRKPRDGPVHRRPVRPGGTKPGPSLLGLLQGDFFIFYFSMASFWQLLALFLIFIIYVPKICHLAIYLSSSRSLLNDFLVERWSPYFT